MTGAAPDMTGFMSLPIPDLHPAPAVTNRITANGCVCVELAESVRMYIRTAGQAAALKDAFAQAEQMHLAADAQARELDGNDLTGRLASHQQGVAP